ncbi:hypothetical protein NDU88_009067 [Pleurodeles waltl]|uniref:Uncharacterized protein n=1 Tax=Pleurodeles waltl TaxID=8319 RepID=A0AAV7PTW7_PLEWA|nr:hypothetical protein NDU88_009067 [Pleurodeles waltl]
MQTNTEGAIMTSYYMTERVIYTSDNEPSIYRVCKMAKAAREMQSLHGGRLHTNRQESATRTNPSRAENGISTDTSGNHPTRQKETAGLWTQNQTCGNKP